MTASRRQIARAAGLVSVLFAVSRLLGLVREMVIGAQFGTSGTLDAYLAAFRLPDMIFYLVAGGALGSAFIPTFSATLIREDDPRHLAAWRLASSAGSAPLSCNARSRVMRRSALRWAPHPSICPRSWA